MLVTALILVGLATAGCTGQHRDSGAGGHRTFTYTCCRKGDIDTVRHPGEVITLHWIVSEGPPGTSPDPVPVTLSAILHGPFPSVSSLKEDNPSTSFVAAAPVHTTNWVGRVPTSEITIPATAGTGFYNLEIRIVSGASTVSAASVIHVMATGPAR